MKTKQEILKKSFNYSTFLLWITLLFSTNLSGQGCSDAGACSIGSLSGEIDFEGEIPKIKLSYEQGFALGEKFVFISQTALTLEHRVLKTTSYVVRLPFVFTSGNLGNSSGVGDILISVIQQVYKNNTSQLGFLTGVKLKTNNANLTFAGIALPMAYQTGLGTYDIIVGGQYLWKSWDFYLAYQHPFERNENGYLNYPLETDERKNYFESAKLKRGDDLAFRVQKSFPLKKKQSLLPGIMSIYRIQKSEIVKADQNVVLDGSKGLTLNVYLTYVKKLKGNGIIFITGAFPIVDRDYRADGLTRNFVLSFKLTQLW